MLGLLTAITLVLAACGGSGGSGGTAATARDLRDPRSVPTATVANPLPSPLAAVDLAQPVRRQTPLPDVYIVKAGDIPGAIAQELGVELAELLRLNGIEDPRSLRVGQQLRVPRPSVTPTPTGGRAVVNPVRTATLTATAASQATATRTSTPSLGAATATVTPPRPGATITAATPTRPATAVATATAAANAPGSYTVEAGDTACAIAQKLGVPLAALAEANGVTVAGLAALRIGQSLRVPTNRGPAGC